MLFHIFLLLSVLPIAVGGSDCDDASEQKDAPAWVQDGGFLILIIGVCAMFWGLAVVCEEYFVPALNILCEELNVPDDVAGATFMAAGASSPELFTSFIALFINHSAIGVGTVVGSEIFNHMIICAGSVLYSTTGVLQLDKWIFTRDVASYMISLIILIWALKGDIINAIPRMFNPSEQDKCLNVTIYHAAGLVAMYAVYAVVSGCFQTIMKHTCGVGKSALAAVEEDLVVNVLTEPSAEEIRRLQEADADRLAGVLADMLGGEPGRSQALTESRAVRSVALKKSMQLQRSVKYRPNGAAAADGDTAVDLVDWSHHRSTFVPDAPLYTWRSSALHLPNLEDEALDGVVQIVTAAIGPASGFFSTSKVFKAEYCTMALAPTHLSAYLQQLDTAWGVPRWRRRYYTLDHLGFHSRKALTSPVRGPHIVCIDLKDVISVEITSREEGLFQLLKRGGEKMKLCAPSVDIMTTFASRLGAFVEELRQKKQYERDEFVRTSSRELQHGVGCPELEAVSRDFGNDSDREHEHGCLLDPPLLHPGDVWAPARMGLHIGLYPLKFLMYHSLPDVAGKAGRPKYIRCIVVSVVWLAVLSFVMIQCCDAIGGFIGASPIVMGLTLSAVGTSFPNLWSSMLVARQGLGDMAVSNAFGSNTFNICIALGLPWLVLVLSDDMRAYDKMRDDGIVLMLSLLLIVLIVFYVVVMIYDWQIRLWMAYYYIMTYFVIMVYAIING